ncbi:MAG: polyphosphate:AMP phosphotransferase [Kiloniellales bacterium]|nr:polyphosphate:AMP phosphotransferase [Kiloniellales bacterium]MDJ0969558.1 polyphosphate:AMP phosphotransferase [Kiloniellales bacterium]MDJ0982848.1 polyphosphate:AMP phosphotransferase [Kiloniellales bacterium]
MFESLMLPHEIDKADFDAEEPQLRGRLIDAQFDLLESGDFPVILLLAGIDALGRSAAAKQLLSWMDPRHVRPYAAVRPSEEERDRPRMWRFWQALPRKGRVGIFLNSWYDGPTRDYFLGRIGRGRFRDRIEEIQRFEQLLAQEGALIIKAFFYLPKKQTAKEFKKLTKSATAAWKLSDEETEFGKELVKRYDDAIELLEELIGVTSTAYAPWIPIASADSRYRDLTIGRTLADAIRGRLSGAAPAIAETGTSTLGSRSGPNILDSLDLGQALKRDDYRARLKEEQRRLTALTLSRKFEKRAVVAVFEGNDAAGKGGGIRRVVQALDPRMTRVISIAAPSDEEKAQPYLWRFWRHIPKQGHVAIFDRSWYGRVLVERVEGFAAKHDWMRAYDEIRFFEAELSEAGIIVVKFWLAIDKKEQLRRFKEREKIGYKRYKITDEDWRNRKKWDAYKQAVHDMVDRTSTTAAPWTLVEANDKLFARVKVLKAIADRLEAEL